MYKAKATRECLSRCSALYETVHKRQPDCKFFLYVNHSSVLYSVFSYHSEIPKSI